MPTVAVRAERAIVGLVGIVGLVACTARAGRLDDRQAAGVVADATGPRGDLTQRTREGGAVVHDGAYVMVNGVRTYYETHGHGSPVLLLHGGAVSLDSFDAQTAALAEHYDVIEADRMGHGRTADADRPFHYHDMAEDTVALLAVLGVKGPVDVLGWSDGGIIGLDLAIHHPDLVRRLCISGANFQVDGVFTPPGWEGTAHADELSRALRKAAADESPDGAGHAEAVLEKLALMWKTEPEYTLAELGRIRAPTLVIVGDHDIIRPEHTLALFRAIPGAELAIVPGASHFVPLEKPQEFNRLVLDFLAAPGP